MGEAPDSSKILDILTSFDRGVQAGQAADALLQMVLKSLAAYIPPSRFARLYRWNGNEAVFWGTTADLPPDNSTLERLTSLWSSMQPTAERGHWLLPLGSADHPVGLLEIAFEREDAIYQPIPEWLILLTGQMAASLRSRALRELIQQAEANRELASRLIHTSHQIALSESYAEMLTAALDAMPAFVDVTGVALFDRPIFIDEIPGDIEMAVVVTRDKIIEPDIHDHADPDEPRLFPALKRLLDGEMFVMPDLTDYKPILAANGIGYLRDQEGIRSLGTLGLRSGPRLLGMLTFGSRQGLPGGEDLANFRAVADQIAINIENRHLLSETAKTTEQLRGQVRVLQTLNQLSASISSTQDEKDLLYKTCEALVMATGVAHVVIILLDASKTTWMVSGEYPAQGTVGTQWNAADDPLQNEMRQSRQPVFVTDITAETRLRAEDRRLFQERGVLAFLLMPLLDMKENYIGSVRLELTHLEQHPTADVVGIVRTITNQTAVALQNITLLRDTQRRAEQLQQIAAFSQSVQATLEMASLYEIAMAQTTQIITLDHMSIILYDPLNRRLRAVAQYDDGQTYVDHLPGGGKVVKPEGSIIARVWDTKRPLHIPDMRWEPDLRYPLRDDLRALVVTPVFSRGSITGMITVGSMMPYSYNDTDLAVLRQMVNQLTVAIENAEAYTQTQSLAKNKVLANEIATQLQQQMDIDSILQVTLNELGKALGARRGRIRLGMQPDRNGQY